MKRIINSSSFAGRGDDVIVCSGLIYEIHSGGGPSMYIYCVECYHVSICKNGCRVFVYCYILDDE